MKPLRPGGQVPPDEDELSALARKVRTRITASDAELMATCRRHVEALGKNLPAELLHRLPASVPGRPKDDLDFSRRRIGPATRAGVYMAVLAVGLALCAADPRVAAAKGGVGITLLHVLGTGLFAAMLLREPWRIRYRKLGLAALVLGTSTALEAWRAQYPWDDVQFVLRTGCAVVAMSMASLVIFAARPTRRMKGFFFTGLLVGAAGSLIVSVGAFIAFRAVYPLDRSSALAHLVVAVGAWGLGLKCLGLRVLPIPGRTSSRPADPPGVVGKMRGHLKRAGDLLELCEHK